MRDKYLGRKYKTGDIVKHNKWTKENNPQYVYVVIDVVLNCTDGDKYYYLYRPMYPNKETAFVRECYEFEEKTSFYEETT